MNQKQRIVTGIAGRSVKSYGRILDTKKNDDPPVTELIILSLGIIALASFFGHIVMKVMFRKTPVINKADLLMVILGFLAFFGYGCFMLGMYLTLENKDLLGGPISYLISGVLVAMGSIAFLRKGVKYYRLSSKNEDKSILNILSQEGWSDDKIKNLGEPLLVLLSGLFLTVFNPFLGLLMVACSLSEWIHIAYEAVMNRIKPEKPDTAQGKVVGINEYYPIN